MADTAMVKDMKSKEPSQAGQGQAGTPDHSREAAGGHTESLVIMHGMSSAKFS